MKTINYICTLFFLFSLTAVSTLAYSQTDSAAKIQNWRKTLMDTAGKINMASLDSLKKYGAIKPIKKDSLYAKTYSLKEKLSPTFKATDINGRVWDMSTLNDKVVVLNFWFTGCKPCIQEMPLLNQLVDEYKNKDVVFLSLAPENKDVLKKFLTKTPFKYNILPESKEISRNFFISGYPTHFVIDKKGIVKKIMIGYSNDIDSLLKSAINNALAYSSYADSSRQNTFSKFIQNGNITREKLDSILKSGTTKIDFDSLPGAIALSKMKNKQAPHFKVKDVYDNEIDLQKLRGKIVVLNFWFTGCSGCVKEIPDLNKIYKQYSDNVCFISFAPEEKDYLKKYLKEREFLYQVVPSSKPITAEYNVTGFPTHMIIDKNGIIREIQTGASEQILNKLKMYIESASQQ